MKNLTSNSITKFLIIFVLVILLPLGLWNFYNKRLNHSVEKTDSDALSEVDIMVQKLSNLWFEGDLEGKNEKCSDIPSRENMIERTKCNTKFIKCLLNKKYLNFSVESFNEDQKGNLEIEFRSKKLKNTFVIKLENSCQEVYLPKNIYADGPVNAKKNTWDNYLVDIFIDRFYATDENQNVITNFNLAQMENYCKQRGKYLLYSHVFDAAAFYPSKVKASGHLYKYKYPWGRDESIPTELTYGECEKSFNKECLDKFKYDDFSKFGISWNGIYHVLGSRAEAFDNRMNIKGNLALSSMNMNFENFWNQNGVRTFWSGDIEYDNSISFEEIFSKTIKEKSIVKGIAFRCMRIK